MDEINEWQKRELPLQNEIEGEELFHKLFVNIVRRDCRNAKQGEEVVDNGYGRYR